MIRKLTYYIVFVLALLSCSKKEIYTPKPVGYFRIEIPAPAYEMFAEEGYPYQFEKSQYATIQPRIEPNEQYWIDIHYPQWSVDVHCSYKPIHNNLRALAADAQEFVFKHATKATGLPAQEYSNDEAAVWCVFYNLEGETASPCQCYVTDSTHHFFRAAVYFNCIPNIDSLKPITDFMRNDLRHLVETFEWR